MSLATKFCFFKGNKRSYEDLQIALNNGLLIFEIMSRSVSLARELSVQGSLVVVLDPLKLPAQSPGIVQRTVSSMVRYPSQREECELKGLLEASRYYLESSGQIDGD